MTILEANQLFAYGRWANERTFAAAEALASDDLARVVTSSYPTIRGTLGHIVMAEWVWLRRWVGQTFSQVPPWTSEGPLAELKEELAFIESERDRFLGTLSDADLERPVEYKTLAGEAQSDPLGSLMRHVVNHGTYHRGQVATQLRQLGQTPPSTDLVVWRRGQP